MCVYVCERKTLAHFLSRRRRRIQHNVSRNLMYIVHLLFFHSTRRVFLFFFLNSLCFVTHIDVGRIKGRRRRNKETRLTPLVFRGCADSCGGTVYTVLQEGEQRVYSMYMN
jgi:hypothetical protein